MYLDEDSRKETLAFGVLAKRMFKNQDSASREKWIESAEKYLKGWLLTRARAGFDRLGGIEGGRDVVAVDVLLPLVEIQAMQASIEKAHADIENARVSIANAQYEQELTAGRLRISLIVNAVLLIVGGVFYSGLLSETEPWLSQFRSSIAGPVPFALATIGIAIAGSSLVFIQNLNSFLRTLFFIVIVWALLIAGHNLFME